MEITTRGKAQLYTEGPNIDAYYGPWNNSEQFETWVDDQGLDIYPGTLIAVYDDPSNPETSTLTHYVRENGAWREFGGSTEIDLSGLSESLQDESGNTTLVSAINKAATLGPSGGSGGDYTTQIKNPKDDTKIGGEDGYITLYNIKEYLEDEYAPVWTDATCVISINNFPSNKLLEIGSTLPTKNNFSISGQTAVAASKSSATGGSISEQTLDDPTTTTKEIKIGDENVNIITKFEIIGSIKYAAGTQQVTSTKGGATNRTANSSKVLLTQAPVNSNIDETTYLINEIIRSDTYTINLVFRIYTNKSDITSFAAETLEESNSTSLDITFVAETISNHHSFDLPYYYKLSSVKVWDANSNGWKDYGTTKFQKIESTYTHLDASNRNINYTRYVRNDGLNGSTRFQINFTK